jgi:hypothetical protein
MLAACVLSTAGSRIDRRVVDVAEAGNAESEATHGYAGHDAFTGVAGGKPYRQARGWMHYALTTFDDTEVTVAFDFLAVDSMPRRYDVVVEDSLIATRTFSSTASTPVAVELTVPFSITKGKTNIAVTVRARGGLTPALHALRTIQDHNEVDHAGAHGTSPSLSPSPRPQQLPGAVR